MIHVIVITFQRAQHLDRCLESLRHLKAVPFQTHVLINGNDQEAFAVSKKYQIETLKCLQDRKSLSFARNDLINEIKSIDWNQDWFLFLDDDAYLPEGYGQELQKTLQKNEIQKVGIIGGPNLTSPEGNAFALISGEWLSHRFVAGNVERRYRKQEVSYIMKNDDGLILCHMLIRADLFKKDQFLNHIRGGEENLFLENYFQQGGLAYYDGQLSVYHERRANFWDFYKQIWKYGEGRGQVIFYAKKARIMHLIPVIFLLYTLIILLNSNIEPYWYLPGFAYLIMNLFVSISILLKAKRVYALHSFWAIPLLHWIYAIGLIRGLLFHK